MLLDLQEAKQLNRIPASDTSQDAIIEQLLRPVQDYICDHCNNSFKLGDVWFESNQITFNKADPPTIVHSGGGGGFIDNEFTDLNHYVIEGSLDNDRIVEVQTVSNTTLTLVKGEVLYPESNNRIITITRVRFPQGLKLVAAKMIGYDLADNSGISTESIGNYSVSYDFRREEGYPADIMGRLKRYRRVRV